MPYTPYIINGNITDSESIALVNARITLKTSLGSVSGLTNSSGKYLLDLADAGYTAGETITYSVTEPNNNEVVSGTITVTGGGQTLNVSTALRTDKVDPGGVNDIQIHNIGGKIVTANNPFPVSDNGLPENYKSVWVITRSDGQPDSETITLKGVDYKRTFAYTSNILTTRSQWVRQ